MPLSRRQVLTSLRPQSSTHAGLWMDRYLEWQTEEDEDLPRDLQESATGAKSRLIRDLSVSLRIPEGYRDAYRRHAQTLMKQGAKLFVAASLGRVVAWLGARGSLEAGLCIERTWGVPTLPSTGLKGLASTAAHLLVESPGWRRRGEANDETALHRALFGSTDEAGAVVFSDGWWMPRGNLLPIVSDTMTVHHPKYYQGSQPTAPTEMDSPVPIAFAAVRGSFLLGITGESHAIDRAAEILALGLRDLGLGAKTNAGYGRMELKTATWTNDQGLGVGAPVSLPLAAESVWAMQALPVTERRQAEAAARPVITATTDAPSAAEPGRDQARGVQLEGGRSVIRELDQLLNGPGTTREKLEKIKAEWGGRIQGLPADQKKAVRGRITQKFTKRDVVAFRDVVLLKIGL